MNIITLENAHLYVYSCQSNKTFMGFSRVCVFFLFVSCATSMVCIHTSKFVTEAFVIFDHVLQYVHDQTTPVSAETTGDTPSRWLCCWRSRSSSVRDPKESPEAFHFQTHGSASSIHVSQHNLRDLIVKHGIWLPLLQLCSVHSHPRFARSVTAFVRSDWHWVLLTGLCSVGVPVWTRYFTLDECQGT